MGNIGEIGDLWMLRTHKSPISPKHPPSRWEGGKGGLGIILQS